MRGTDSPGLILRPGPSSWKRSDGIPADDLPDPEALAREAVAEIQGALEGLVAILDLLGASSLSRSGEIGARNAGRGLETPPLA